MTEIKSTSRPIKFRAFYTSGLIGRQIRGVKKIRFNEKTEPVAELKGGGTVRFDKLMQFTGLHDRTGKEIYEGDIVENSVQEIKNIGTPEKRNYQPTGEIIRSRHGVVWNDHWASWEINKGMERGILEVIGNVWENPELLTTQ